MSDDKQRRGKSELGPRAMGARASKSRSQVPPRSAARKVSKILANLGAEDGKAALISFAARHPECVAEIEEIVQESVGRTSFEDVADEVVAEIELLEASEIGTHSGPRPWGYIDPSEGATEMVEEAIAPFVATVQRHAEMGLHEAALEGCRGVLLGLYRAERDKVTELLDWIPDSLGEIAHAPIHALATQRRNRGPGGRTRVPRELREFVREHLPKWEWLQR